jgi:hypothetical protein
MGRSNTDPQALVAGPVLSDFDVNYGANAGVLKNRDGDFLYAVITHGLATGKAATLLATRSIGTDQARRTVLITFLRQLSEADIKKAAAALSLGHRERGWSDVASPNDRSNQLEPALGSRSD